MEAESNREIQSTGNATRLAGWPGRLRVGPSAALVRGRADGILASHTNLPRWRGQPERLTSSLSVNTNGRHTRDGIVAWKCPDVTGAPKAARRSGVITYIPCPADAAEQAAEGLIIDIEDINSSGQAVGTVAHAIRESDGDLRWEGHAYLWSGGERFLLPPVAGQPEVSMEPHAINDRGEIVGHSSITVGATLWTIK